MKTFLVKLNVFSDAINQYSFDSSFLDFIAFL